MGRLVDRTGQRFGKLTVVARDQTASIGNAVWTCKCDCGRNIAVRSNNLVSGNTKSCGCLHTTVRGHQFVDLTGIRFGRLVVQEFFGKDNQKQSIWLCRCDCGSTKSIRANFLNRGITQSCGCYAKEVYAANGRAGRKKISGDRSHLWNPSLNNDDRLKRQRDTPEVRDWRKSVLRRDNYVCAVCGKRGGRMQAHHLNSWATCRDQRHDVDNGVAMCRVCHHDFHMSLGGPRVPCTKQDFVKYLNKLIEVESEHR